MPIDETLTASGARVKTKRGENIITTFQDLSSDTRENQERAWKYFRTVGEASFYADSLVGKRVRKYNFPIGWIDDDLEVKPLNDVDHGFDEDQLEVISKVHGSLRTKAGGSPEFWNLLAVNLAVGAEARMILSADGQHFTVVSPLEIKNDGNNLTYSGEKVPNTRHFRVWLPDPKNPKRPWAPLWSAFSELDDIRWLKRYISSRTRNRLVQNDILVVPNSITPPDIDPARANAQAVGPETKINSFEHSFREIARQNLSLQNDSNQIPMPMIAFVPDEAIKNNSIQWISAEHKIDASLLNYLRNLRESFANNVSVPAEMITGLSDANHWNASLIEDDLEYGYIEPFANELSMSVTIAYFRGAVQAVAAKNGIAMPEDKVERLRLFGSSARKKENPDYVRNLLRAFDLGIVAEEPVADALGIPRQFVLSIEEQERRKAARSAVNSNESAPSRQQDQRNQPEDAPQADPERSRDDASYRVWLGMLEHEVHRTVGNRILNYAKRDQDILDALQLAKDPSQIGRFANKATLRALDISESKIWEGLNDRIEYAARFYYDPQYILDHADEIAESIRNSFWG